jgi:hypothetical protein
MALLPNEQSIVDFMGRTICVKNTFIHTRADSILGFHRKEFRIPRSKSVPASAERYIDLPAPDAAQMPAEGKLRATSDCTHSVMKKNVPCQDKVLTLMMKNMPCHLRRSDILAAIEEVGFKHRHDFFYVPTRRNRILGYAFISFPDPRTAAEFEAAMTGYEFKNSFSGKSVVIAPATIQGFDENLKHFSTTAVMQTDAKPLFANAKLRL